MWRFGFSAGERAIAADIIPAIEHGAGIPVFPSYASMWHFENKLAQSCLLEAAGIPTPANFIFHERESALDFIRRAEFPLVAKLSSGYQSSNVVMLKSRGEANRLVDNLFGPGVYSFEQPRGRLRRLIGHRAGAVKSLLNYPFRHGLQGGYFYAQEYLPGNAFDTRVTVIGNRAFGFRRFNRDGDFRASGSGKIDWNPREIPGDLIKQAFHVARKLGTQSLALDFLYQDTRPLVAEISYTYAAWAIEACPGHWQLQDGDQEPAWSVGPMKAEDAIFEDFLHNLVATAPAAE
ncbi:ATP-grasp domain-containing protein [Parahaliea aestuarii]|uniref:ATP-grasp domain-containing protein n=1 Tax=Parahaliea aestuarii TaxID=1852021 RepID=A0A5C8ZVI9_9GAMM|nr:hypothetical protein [Parahaliea aestuarii]TXS92466.1 hypothetical protein FVW59_08585 [Parahaliea aestuarii]